MTNKKKQILRISETAVMLALSTILSMIVLFDMPMGGSVTPFSMLPVMVIAYRYGFKWGLLTGAVYGVLQMFLGMNNLSYATNWVAAVCIILFDYVVAYMAVAFAGLFRKLKNQAIGFSIGVVIACVLRFICHFITGVTVWADYSDGVWPVVSYSLIYNGSYLLPELGVTIVVGAVLMSLLDVRGESIRPLKRSK